jgi:hypothetical protein
MRQVPTFPFLDNGHLSAEIDVGRGADILSLTHRASGVDVLFSAPWRERAEAVRDGRVTSSATDSFTRWLEQYRGGWQTLCPNAGPERLVAGAAVGFHGEASIVPWTVDSVTAVSASLRTELFSVPVEISRDITLSAGAARLDVVDTVTNLSDVEIELDYAAHPALGGAFLDAACVLRTSARRFTADPDTPGNVAAEGSCHDWPEVRGAGGDMIDLTLVPPPGQARMAFGWLSDFGGSPWASVTNPDLGLTVRLEWDEACLPYAWLWQELNASPGFPWFRRARVMAVEPSSTPTSGPDRRSVLRLGARQGIRIPLAFSIEDARG